MALETLANVAKIGEFNVVQMDKLRELHPEKFNESGGMDYKWFEAEIRPTNFIYVRQDVNSISFTLQKGPIKEVGVNGCQVETMLQAVQAIVGGLNAKFPCKENTDALEYLAEAIECMAERKRNREARGVEGLARA